MEHNWAPIDQDEDPSEMSTVCFECKCCGTPSEECSGKIDESWLEFPVREAVKSMTGATDEEVDRLGGLNR